MDKLSKKDVERVKDTLKDFITKTAGCEDSVELNRMAVHHFGKAFSDKPALAKQAASAYNSNKSIFKLSNEQTRESDFALIDAQDMFEKINKQASIRTIEKSANSDFVVHFYKDTEPVQKVASSVAKPADVSDEDTLMSNDQVSDYFKELISDRNRVLMKAATRRDICAHEALDYYDTFCSRMRMLSKEARAQVARNLISEYPIDGKKLIDRYSEDNALDKIANFKPIAGSKKCPQGDIYTKAQDCMIAEFAKEQADRIFKEAASDTIKRYKQLPGIYKMYKNASNTVAQAFTGSFLSKPLADSVFPDAKESSAIYKDILKPRLINQLRELEVKNLLVDMYSEPFIASYPADEIEEATTKALQMLPPGQRKHPRRHMTYIKALTAEILGRGGNMSAADVDKILTASKTFDPELKITPLNADLY